MNNPLDPEFLDNYFEIFSLYQNIISTLAQKPDIKIDPFNFSKTVIDLYAKLVEHPDILIESQFEYFQNYFLFLGYMEKRQNDDQTTPLYQPNSKDLRFKDDLWNSPYFDGIKQLYLMNSEFLKKLILKIDNNEKTRFITRQFIDALAPTNFILTNPVVLSETLETKGANLINGLKKFQNDLKNSDRFLEITTVNKQAFKIGENIATAKGNVIYQNHLMQLIKYDNSGGKAYDTPVLITPPWINKYYILDLRDENSYIKWLISQGFSVYIISWVNPDESHKDINFEDYMKTGVITAIDEISKLHDKSKINMVGYCLGGTLLACTIAYLTKLKDKRIRSATFLTTLIDFSEAGELAIFASDDQLNILEAQMDKDGFHSGPAMNMTFNLLKSNEMIWNFFINNYLLGKDSSEFDLLYWNSDSTRLPATMHSFYLRNMYQKNLLAKPNALKLNDVPVDVSLIDIPCYFLATKEDHIVPWQSCFKSLNMFKKSKFILAASGHVGGVINHPSNNKYCYWINDNTATDSNKWLENAEKHDGSWWNDWLAWLISKSGKKTKLSNMKVKSLEPAPGSYVLVK